MTKLLTAAAIAGVLTLVPVTVSASPESSFDDLRSRIRNVWQSPTDNDDDSKDSRNSSDDDKDASYGSDDYTDSEGEGSGTGDDYSSGSGSSGNASKPGDIIDMKQWYLTLPTGPQGSPDTIEQSKLGDFTSKFMHLNDKKDGVVFVANAGGVHTKNSKYPRSELREMDGSKKASWDGSQGKHTMTIRQAVTKLPPQKAEVVVGQIHGTSDDLMQVHLSGKKLTVKYDDGSKKVPLDDNYQLGKPFTVKIESSDGKVKVWYDGKQKADLPISSDTSYFKAGNYLQTNTSKGDKSDATAEVVIYDLDIKHEQ